MATSQNGSLSLQAGRAHLQPPCPQQLGLRDATSEQLLLTTMAMFSLCSWKQCISESQLLESPMGRVLLGSGAANGLPIGTSGWP